MAKRAPGSPAVSTDPGRSPSKLAAVGELSGCVPLDRKSTAPGVSAVGGRGAHMGSATYVEPSVII